jgi:hypothetical protein
MKVSIAAFISFSTGSVSYWEKSLQPLAEWGYRVTEWVDVDLPECSPVEIATRLEYSKLAKLAELEKALSALRGAA